jgi:hypothetical protein
VCCSVISETSGPAVSRSWDGTQRCWYRRLLPADRLFRAAPEAEPGPEAKAGDEGAETASEAAGLAGEPLGVAQPAARTVVIGTAAAACSQCRVLLVMHS